MDYFDRHLPRYIVSQDLIDFIGQYSKPNSSIIDIGVGTGDVLALVAEQIGERNLYGMDISRLSLQQAQERTGCRTYWASILEKDLAEKVGRKFDIAIMKSILHHLISRNRNESKRLAISAIENAAALLNDKGYLVIGEPGFYPSFSMDILFYIKKFFSRVTTRRLEIFSQFNNIGPPVVSYYTNEQLVGMINNIPFLRIRENRVVPRRTSALMRATLITKAISTFMVVQKA